MPQISFTALQHYITTVQITLQHYNITLQQYKLQYSITTLHLLKDEIMLQYYKLHYSITNSLYTALNVTHIECLALK